MALAYNVGDLVRIRDYSAFSEELAGKNIIGKITRITDSPTWPYKVLFSDPVNDFYIE